MEPVISIIIPVYNAENFLIDCLNSIVQQNFQKWECILINDGSKDNSGSICDVYASRDSRFKVFHKLNEGVSSARNVGIDMAVGEWFCFVDSDDMLVVDALSYMFELNVCTKSDVCLCSIVKKSNIVKETKILDAHEKKKLIWSCLSYRTSQYAKRGFMIDAPHAKLFRSSIIKNNRLRYVEGLCKSEDALFDAQYYYYANRIVMDSHPVYIYTLNPNSICHTFRFYNISMFEKLINEEKCFIDKFYANDSLFDDVLNIRAFVAFEQVLFESGVNKMSMSIRTKALRIFLDLDKIYLLIANTKYEQISSYFPGRSRRLDLWLAKNKYIYTLCVWVDLCEFLLSLRVLIVKDIKKVLRINHEKSLSSMFHK